jgi:hypothetical protein
MTPDARAQAIHQCVLDADFEIIQSLLASPFSASVSRFEAARLRSMASEKLCPQEHAQLQACESIRSHLVSQSKNYVDAYKSILPEVHATPHVAVMAKLKQGA